MTFDGFKDVLPIPVNGIARSTVRANQFDAAFPLKALSAFKSLVYNVLHWRLPVETVIGCGAHGWAFSYRLEVAKLDDKNNQAAADTNKRGNSNRGPKASPIVT